MRDDTKKIILLVIAFFAVIFFVAYALSMMQYHNALDTCAREGLRLISLAGNYQCIK